VVVGDISVFIGYCAAEQSHVALEALIEQVLLAHEVYKLNPILSGAFIHFAALNAGVDEGSETDLGYKAGAAGSDFAPQVDDYALGQAPALKLILKGQFTEGKGRADVRSAPLCDKAGPGLSEAGGASCFPVAHCAALTQVKSAGMSGFFETVTYGAGNFFGPAGKTHSAYADSGVIGNQSRSFLCGYKFSHLITPPVIYQVLLFV
jgi:hypothetical protein